MRRLLGKLHNTLVVKAINEIRKRDESIKHLRAEKAELYKQLHENDMYNKVKVRELKKEIETLNKNKGVNIYA